MTSRFIRFGWYLIFILTMGAGHVHAELRVMTDLEHSTCLQYEPVNIMVFLLNETHKTIMVGANTNNGERPNWVDAWPLKAFFPDWRNGVG